MISEDILSNYLNNIDGKLKPEHFRLESSERIFTGWHEVYKIVSNYYEFQKKVGEDIYVISFASGTISIDRFKSICHKMKFDP